MPKRKHAKESDRDRLQRKISKLQHKLQVLDKPDSDCDTSSDLEEVPSLLDTGADTPALRPTDWLIDMSQEVTEEQMYHDTVAQDVTNRSTVLNEPGPSSSAPADTQENTTEELCAPAALNNDVLEILGEEPPSAEKFGPDIRSELANRLVHIATEGLTKESRKDLVSKYLIPSNCAEINAPKLNLEIKAAIAEPTSKRDKGIEIKQKQLASAISCLSEVINFYITAETRNNEMLQKLMDVSRILCDIQHADSITRRNFILFSLKNNMKDHLKLTKIDTCLFGTNLAETLKQAKAVNKSVSELKEDKTSSQRASKPTSVTRPLNRRAPPPTRRAPGAAPPPPPPPPRSRRPPAPRAPPPPAPAHSSRTLPQQHPRHRRY